MNPPAGAHLDSFAQGLDLLDGCRQALRQGLTHEQVRHQELVCVILTGGSSAWPFIVDIVTEELKQIEPSRRLSVRLHPSPVTQLPGRMAELASKRPTEVIDMGVTQSACQDLERHLAVANRHIGLVQPPVGDEGIDR